MGSNKRILSTVSHSENKQRTSINMLRKEVLSGSTAESKQGITKTKTARECTRLRLCVTASNSWNLRPKIKAHSNETLKRLQTHPKDKPPPHRANRTLLKVTWILIQKNSHSEVIKCKDYPSTSKMRTAATTLSSRMYNSMKWIN